MQNATERARVLSKKAQIRRKMPEIWQLKGNFREVEGKNGYANQGLEFTLSKITQDA